MRHGSVCSGIGGFELAAEWMGWKNIFYCEIDAFCRSILKCYWPDAKAYTDINNMPADELRGTVDVLTGGFPCQPFSVAGRQQGTADHRYLWPAMLRIIKAVQPRWVVAENVPGLLGIERGMVFEQVCLDLETAGYQVQPVVLPAVAVGAPHLRNRIWFIAYTPGRDNREVTRSASGQGRSPASPIQKVVLQEKRQTSTDGPGAADSAYGNASDTQGNCDRGNAGTMDNTDEKNERTERHNLWTTTDGRFSRSGQTQSGAHADIPGLEGWKKTRDPRQQGPATGQHAGGLFDRPGWDHWPAQSPFCGGDDGVPSHLDGITLSKWRRQSLHAYGNAIVPQLALEIFYVIELLDQQLFANKAEV